MIGLAPSGTRDRIAPQGTHDDEPFRSHCAYCYKSFIDAGADAYVVGNFSAAEKLVESKKIDTALVRYEKDAETVSFCSLLYLKNIPRVFTAEPPPRYSPRKPMAEASVAVQAILWHSDVPSGQPPRS